MKRSLFNKIGLCVIVLFSLCGMAVLVGRQQNGPGFIPELQACGDALCFLGILPGITSWDEGLNIIKQVPRLKNSTLSDTLFLSVGPRYSIGVSSSRRGEADPNDGLIEEIKISVDEANIYAGALIRQFGLPCFIQSMNGGLNLGYSNAVFVIVSDAHYLTPESPIRYILLRPSTTGPGCPKTQSTGPSTIHQWDGFGRYY